MTSDGCNGGGAGLRGVRLADLVSARPMTTDFWSWWAAWQRAYHLRTIARHRAIRHMSVIARAVYTGSTAAYELVPDLPRYPESSSNVNYASSQKPV